MFSIMFRIITTLRNLYNSSGITFCSLYFYQMIAIRLNIASFIWRVLCDI